MKRHVIRFMFVLPFLALVMLVCSSSAYAQFDFSACEGVEPQSQISKDCLNIMSAFSEPLVIPVPLDVTTLSNYSFWRVIGSNPNIFDAPGGSVVRQLPNGFNFVRVIDSSVDGWVQIETGEWMMAADVEYREASYYRGVRILNGLQTEFAWVLGDMFSHQYPGSPQDTENGRLLLRYDRVNIFAKTVDEDGWAWYMIGPDQWVEQRMVAKVFPIERPEGVTGRWVVIDLYEQTLVAYENDTPVFATLVSSGYPPNETNEGLFEVWARLDVDGMSGFTGAPEAYALQSVPWVMYFDGSAALHGTYWHDVFGYRSSRGCVNLSISDASFLFHWFDDSLPNEDGVVVNYVYVYSSGEYRPLGT